MDLRLLPLALGLWFSTSGTLVVSSFANPFNFFIWLLLLFLLSYLLIFKVKMKTWQLISSKFLVVGLFIGVLLSLIRLEPLLNGPLKNAVAENAVINVSGTLLTDPVRSNTVSGLDLSTRDFGTFKLRTHQLSYRGHTYQLRVPIQVFVSGENSTKIWQVPPGTQLSATGKIKEADLLRGVAGNVTTTQEIKIISPPPNYQLLAANFRIGLHDVLSFANPDVAGLIPGLALGDDSRISPELEADMKTAGLAHLTAVSGSNVTLLIAIVLAIGRFFRWSSKANYSIALVTLAAFVVLVRPQPSVLRASVMGLIMVFALITKSRKSPLPALVTSVILLIALDPWLSISYGFALSVFATGGLLVWAKSLLVKADELLPQRIPEWVVVGLVITTSAQLAVFPLLVALDSEVSLGSLPANLISVPLAGPTMVFGLLAAFFVPIYFTLAKAFAWLATIPAYGISISAKLIADQHWMVIPWPKGTAGVLLGIFLVLVIGHLIFAWPRLTKDQKQISILGFLVFSFLLWQSPTKALTNWMPSNWQMVSCDVGQGDATLIRTARREAILIDVGGDPKLINDCLAHANIDRIPLLLLTHFHADHVVGLPGALANREVGQIRVSPLTDPPLTTAFVNDVLTELGQKSSVLAYPEYLKINNLEIFTIWPKVKLSQASDTPNNASVSILIKTPDLTMLLPGDVEPPAQNAILNLVGTIKVDVIKIPHHGSRYQSADFAKAASPKLAIVSSGIGNTYGHPAIETIFLYEAIGAKVLRTDQLGSIAIYFSDGKILASTEK